LPAKLVCSADYSVVQEDLDAGEVTNVATANYEGESSAPDTVTVSGTQAPELTIEKSTETESLVSVGQIVTYNYLVTNIGNTTITNAITVSDDKIADVTCPALPADGLLPNTSLTCSAEYSVTQVSQRLEISSLMNMMLPISAM